jgi:hypothetical protein
MRLIKLFKYELIKIIVFLFLFVSTLVVVLSAQENYYDHGKNRENMKNFRFPEKFQSQNNLKN